VKETKSLKVWVMSKSSSPPKWLDAILVEIQHFTYVVLYLAVAVSMFAHHHIPLFVRVVSISAAVVYLVLVYAHAAITFTKAIPKTIGFWGACFIVFFSSGLLLLCLGLFAFYLAPWI
jgi:hypothetical protein